jgi:hypothetical protein
MDCLFCCDADTDDKPETGNDLICPLCVQKLLEADQEDLRRAHGKAIERGYARKAKAIESFLIEGELTNEPEAKKPERSIIRKKPMRMVRPTRNQLRPQQATI